jgi:release factor glutamine methyltransferase
VTVLEVIQRSTDFLARKEVDSPRLQIELLLAHVLQMPRMKLYLNFERTLTDAEVEALRGLVRRRSEREPLQHIVGSTSFCGFEMTVNRHVLIPRPETELLAEQAWNFAGTLRGEQPVALDFGTGSGCLAVALAAKCPALIVHAVDISAEALATARQNAARNGVDSRIQFHLGNGFETLPADLSFDLVVSNPPYIPRSEIETLEPEVRDHDPRLALDGGEDGLDFYRAIAREGLARLRPEGRLFLELGAGQAQAVSGLFTNNGWCVVNVLKDYSARERILIARRAD